MTGRTLIIGSGMAGISLAREVRKLDPGAELIVLSADAGDFYSKPALSNAIAAGKAPASLVLSPAARLEGDLRMRLVSGVGATAVDPVAKVVHTEAGDFPYAQLVLAVGARPRRLPISGDGADAMLSVNDLADYARLRKRLEGARSVAIVGAGLIGCEFANDLRVGGWSVDVFDVGAQPLGALLPMFAAQRLGEALQAAGVGLRLGAALTAVERSGEGFVLRTAAGFEGRYDVVVSAVGLQPDLALARSAGLRTAAGIVTDRFLRTSAPDIFALGDCAEVEGTLLPFVLPITLGARSLARTLLGEPTPVDYPAMPVVLKTPALPTVVCPPPPSGVGDWEVEQDADGLRGLHVDRRSGDLDGFVLQGARVRERQSLAARLPGPFARQAA